jgi:hypothetical protein
VATVPPGIAVLRDVVITDCAGRIIVAVELDDRSHQAKRQRRDLLLEEVLKQAGIPLLRR